MYKNPVNIWWIGKNLVPLHQKTTSLTFKR